MEHNREASDSGVNPEIEYIVVNKKRNPLRIVLRVVIIVMWFLILLLPLVFFALAIQGDITIARGGIPDSHEHPLLQLSLISEVDSRGLRITTTSISKPDELNLCVQTNVRFALWEGEGESASFCDCYVRQDSISEWQFESYVDTPCEE